MEVEMEPGQRTRQMNGDSYSLVPHSDPLEQSVPGDPQEEDPKVVWNAEVAAGRAMSALKQKAKGYCMVERNSVYGAAMALPQFARTAGWSLAYTGEMIRAFIFLALNIILQGFLLYMINREERILDKFEGQMHLCNFGAQLRNCPDAPNCIGPGGTPYAPERLFNWQVWSTRVFVRDGLLALFPDRAEDISQHVDPGEYGLESYYLRFLCCFIFVMGLWSDLTGSIEMISVMTHVPSAAQPWMTYDVPSWDTKERAKAVHSWVELDLVKFKVAGMSVGWKIFNLIFVLLPKFYLWILTLDTGTVFLMETSDIEEMIINAVALGFILSIDELICTSLGSPITTYMLENMEGFPLFDLRAEENDTDQDAWTKNHVDKNWHILDWRIYWDIIPVRLLVMAAISAFFIVKYYIEKCVELSDGSWVSSPLYLPISDTLPFLSFILGPLPSVFQVPLNQKVKPQWAFHKTFNGTVSG